MTATHLLVSNFIDTRERSLKLWKSIPLELFDWKPKGVEMSIIETIKHVLENEHLNHKIIENKGDLINYSSPWESTQLESLEGVLSFSVIFRNDFIEMLKNIQSIDLAQIKIIRTNGRKSKNLGAFLNRMIYHEVIHIGEIQTILKLKLKEC